MPALPAALRIESLLVLLAWMAWALPYVSVDKCRSSNEWIEAIEVQRKIVYDTNKKPASDPTIEGRTRRCLVCRKQFFSAWSGQRICQGCKSTTAWRSGAVE